MRFLLPSLLVLFLCTCVRAQCLPSNQPADYAALEEFYNATNGDDWTNNTGWLTDCDVCDWFGITCNTDGRVTRISLLSNNLVGTIETTNWTEIEQLEQLGLSLNAVSGSFPQSLWFLDELEQINMQDCELSGNFPSPGSNASLRILDIGGNNFINAAPIFGTCPELVTVNLANNNFVELGSSGFDPVRQPNLTTLLAQNNQFFEFLPEELGNYPAGQIDLLRLDGNNFQGCYPTGYSSLCGANLNFTGNPSLPDAGSSTFFGNDFCNNGLNCDPTCDPNYEALAAIYNSTDGDNWTDNTGWLEDCDVCNWAGVNCDADGRVIQLNLNDNNLNGTLPDRMDELTDLEWFFALSNPDLTGSIPPSLFELGAIERIRLQGCGLTGPIPANIANAVTLEDFTAFQNPGLTGALPAGLFELVNLRILWLSSCNFGGPIPSDVAGLTSLEFMLLRENNFTGSLPAELGSLTQLTSIDVASNDLTGELPPSLGNLPNLTRFQVFSNNLSGCYPAEYSSLCDDLLVSFTNNPGLPDGGSSDFFSNVFCVTGQTCDGPCHPDLDALLALYNATDGDNWTDNTGWVDGAAGTDCDVCDWVGITCDANGRVRRLELPDNNLVGILPPEIAQLSEVEFLRFNNNDFEGSSVPDLTGLGSLIRLRLHRTNLAGPLPALGNMPDLTDLSLYDNAFTGEIPTDYNPSSLPALIRLYVDRNQLSGMLPANVTDFTELEEFNAHTNNFSGCYPTSYDQLCDLSSRLFYGNPELPGDGGTAYFEAAVCDIGQFCEIQCPDSYVANSNTAAARFGLLYPDCTELVGRLEYGAAIFSNGDGLQNLTRVGELRVSMLDGNETSGIANIVTVDGRADFFNNSQWTDDGSGPPLALQTVGGALNLRGLSNLTDARLFSNVTTVDSLIIQSGGFTTLEDLAGITSVGKYLEVDLNGDLTSLNGLENLAGDIDRVQIRFNDLLTSLDGLGDELITARLEVSFNDLLTDISGAAGVTVTEQLRITNNEVLAVCAEDYVCDYLTDPDVNVSISGNAPGCENRSEVEAQCGPCHPDLDGLLAFYSATNGPDWTDNSGWADGAAGTDCDVCNWFGVICNTDNRVQGLFLGNNNLSGFLPPAIGQLTELQDLIIGINSIGGNLPEALGGMTNLADIVATSNLFTGTLPDGLLENSNLTRILLSDNDFSGPLPDLADAPNIQIVSFTNNAFTGPMPAFPTLPQLLIYKASGNLLGGSLPASLNATQLPLLQQFTCSSCGLEGPLPETVSDWADLETLFLNNNDLSGCYPADYDYLCSPDIGSTFSGNDGLPDGGSDNFFENEFCANSNICGTLPVTWLAFTATPNGKTVDLRWATTDEEQNAGFTIERSADGRNWSAVGYQPVAAAATNGQHDYAYTDREALSGTSFYRLRQEDLDGTTDYSVLRRVDIITDIRVYPNPAGGLFTVESQAPQTATLFSSDGRQVLTVPLTGARTQVRSDGLKSGVYWLRFSASGDVVRLIIK